MDNINRDEQTQTIEGYYSRRVFFGDMTIDEVPKDIREYVLNKNSFIFDNQKYRISMYLLKKYEIIMI